MSKNGFKILAGMLGVTLGVCSGLYFIGTTASAQAQPAAVSAPAIGAASSTMAAQPAGAAAIDPDAFAAAMQDYLDANPRLLQELSDRLQVVMELEKLETDRQIIDQHADALFNAEDAVVVGNPDGKTTLVEFFDYNCVYCRQAAPDLLTLLDDDPELRVVLIDLPILSEGSVAAAEIGLALSKLGAGAKMLDYHEALFQLTGQVGRAEALEAAEAIGFDRGEVLEVAVSDEIRQQLQQRIDLAQAIGVTGTPTYVLGRSILTGAVGAERLSAMIDGVDSCGDIVCN